MLLSSDPRGCGLRAVQPNVLTVSSVDMILSVRYATNRQQAADSSHMLARYWSTGPPETVEGLAMVGERDDRMQDR